MYARVLLYGVIKNDNHRKNTAIKFTLANIFMVTGQIFVDTYVLSCLAGWKIN